jgi:hypothetical protein
MAADYPFMDVLWSMIIFFFPGDLDLDRDLVPARQSDRSPH